jgi:hypothetical protein
VAERRFPPPWSVEEQLAVSLDRWSEMLSDPDEFIEQPDGNHGKVA